MKNLRFSRPLNPKQNSHSSADTKPSGYLTPVPLTGYTMQIFHVRKYEWLPGAPVEPFEKLPPPDPKPNSFGLVARD